MLKNKQTQRVSPILDIPSKNGGHESVPYKNILCNKYEYQQLTKKHPTHNACKWGAYHNKNLDYLSTI